MLSFIVSYPFFLWLFPAIFLPVLFHLFFKVRKKPYTFSTLMFFLRLDPQLSSKRKIREWIVLALRILLLLFLLLALSGMVLTGIGYGSSASIVLLVDNSGSMSALGINGKNKLDVAKEAARSLLVLFGEGDRTAVVLLVDDITVPLVNGFSSDKKKIADSLEKIRETEATGLVGNALEKACTLLQNARDGVSQEIHIFSDFQDAEWGKRILPKRAIPEKIKIFAHGIASAKMQENAQFTECFFKKNLWAKKNFSLDVSIVNTTEQNCNVRLHSVDDSGRKDSYTMSLDQKQEKKWLFSSIFESPGFHWLLFRIEGDSFTADNHIATGFFCGEKKWVLIAGEKSDFFLTAMALSPFPQGDITGVDVEFVPPSEIMQVCQKKNPVLTVARWDTWEKILEENSDFWRKRWQDGSNALVLPSWNSRPGNRMEAWFGGMPEEPEEKKEGIDIFIVDKQNFLWEDIKEEKGEILLKNIKAYRYYPLHLSDSNGILGLEDDRILMSQKDFGKGKIFLSGLDFNPEFCNLPLKASFVPMLQNMTIVEEDKEEVLYIYAGDPLSKAGAEIVHISSLAGSPLDWKGECSQLAGIPRSGIYVLKEQDRATYLAVSSSPRESKENFFIQGEIPAIEDISFSFLLYKDIDSFLLQNQRKRKGTNLYLPFLFLAILSYCLEGWIANPSLRSFKK